MKITRTSLKSFIKNNDNLFVKVKSDFDGMTDCVQYKDNAQFSPAIATDSNLEHTLGITGLYLVGQSRDYITEYEDENYKGLEIYNCCVSKVIAVKK